MAGIQIPIEVVDKFSKQLGDLDKKMGTLTDAAKKQQSTFNLLSADVIVRYGREAAGAIFKFGEDSLKSFGESEKAVAKLESALKNQGFTSKAYSQALQEQAAALQKVTTSSDETIMGTQTLLTTFGLAGKDLEKTTKAALDLSSGLGIDLRSATLLLGKAWVGETGALSRFGIKIDETAKGAEKFAAVMKQVESRFGGAAQAEANTYAGKVAILTNRFDDLKEKIGKELLPVANFWVDAMNRAMGVIERMDTVQAKMTNSEDRTLVSIRAHIQGIKDEMAKNQDNVFLYAELEKQLARASFGYEKLARAKGISAKASAESDPVSKGGNAVDPAAEKKAKDAQDAIDSEQADLNIKATMKLASATMTNQELLALQDQLDAGMIEKQLGHQASVDFIRAQDLQREKTLNASKLQAYSSLAGSISTLSTSKNKELAAIGKAAAMAQATINTFQGISLAFATVPFPADIAVAALVGAAGAAQVANIAGVQLAEGGIVKARSGGLQTTIGEGGRDEAVIPLDDPRTRQRLAGALGGSQGLVVNVGGINVTVSGDGGDANFMSRLAEAVRIETVDSIKLALRLSNIATLNAGMAV